MNSQEEIDQLRTELKLHKDLVKVLMEKIKQAESEVTKWKTVFQDTRNFNNIEQLRMFVDQRMHAEYSR